MEHRWGERVAVRLPVELACGSAPPVAGSLENVSSSGAFVRTEGGRPARGPVEVILPERRSGRGPSARLAAYVVRETESGVGIEWREFAPRPVRELMIRDRRSGGAGTRARAVPAMHQRLAAEPMLPGTGAPVVVVTAAR